MIIQLSGVLVRALDLDFLDFYRIGILMMRLWVVAMIIQLSGVVARALNIWIFWIGHIANI